MRPLKIGILSKRTTHLTGKMMSHFGKLGHEVFHYSTKNLIINESLLDKDFYILQSKRLFYFYAGYYLEANGIPVIPNTEITNKIKNRIDSFILIQQAGLLQPEYYLGTYDALKKQLTNENFPLIQKPLYGSGSRGVKVLKTINDFMKSEEDVIYLQAFIKGIHYNVYFIGDEICPLKKPPLSNEHVPMEMIDLTDDLKDVIDKWRKKYNLLFGHLDIIREDSTNKLYVVDPGSFPVFTNWKLDENPEIKICNIILKEYERLKN